MTASISPSAMSVEAPEQFERRVDAVFGALDSVARPSDQHGKTTQWSLARQQIYRAGKGEDDSSEGEEQEGNAEQPDLLNTLLDAEDGNVQTDQQGNIVQPSLAFCQALDREQEYDDIDAVAGTSLGASADPADSKPSRLTEVLDDNVFDQRMKLCSSAQPSSATLMDVDTDQHTYQSKQSNSLTQRGSHRRPPLSGGRSGHGHRRSQVPHHVKHPEKYTCYVLDEPLLVGGGDRDSGSSNTDQEKAARAASSAAIAAQQQAQPEASRDALPAFGSGIQFRPTKKVKQQGPSQCAQKTSPAPNLVLSDKDEDMRPASKPALVEASCMDADFGEGAQVTASRPRRRQYRVKSSV